MFFIPDINECLDNNGNCTDFCTNLNGTYFCHCKTGLQLEADNRTCVGRFYSNDTCTMIQSYVYFCFPKLLSNKNKSKNKQTNKKNNKKKQNKTINKCIEYKANKW